MNENLNLKEILKDCPKGWKFWSPLFGEVEFDEISKICNDIYVKANNDGRWFFNADGTITIGNIPSQNIMLYPSKEQQDWSKFTAPWLKKDKFDQKAMQPFYKMLLAPLPYTVDHLEPYISGRTVELHYYKHLQAYIDKVNSQKGDFPLNITIEDLIKMPDGSELYNNASQVFNHYFYFEQLNTKGVKHPLSIMRSLIEKHYGSWDNLKGKIIEAGMDVFGSGWVFLTTDIERKCLWVRSFSGTGTPRGIYEIPIIALDVWEHAYYLDYQNNRKMYIEEFFRLIDWEVVERRLQL